MNGIQKKKGQNIEKFPGCLGRMVNLFDLNSAFPGNRMLTDKPHCDVSSISRSQSDVVRMLSPSFGDHIEDKVIVSESTRTMSNKRANGTPMKMLIAQEMSKEVESKHNPPNVVAKLMGLDALPRQQNNLSAQTQRYHSKGSSRHSLSHSEIPMEGWDHDQGFADKKMQSELNLNQEINKYKDVYEIWQESLRKVYARDDSPQKGRYNDNGNEKRMDLVRQKFMEAKHLVTDEKLRQTKEFQDALEVLSSNRELVLKILEEPGCAFSQHLHNMRSLPLHPETKRITVLRPSKMVDKEKFAGTVKPGDRRTKKPAHMGQVTGWDRDNIACSPFPSPKVDDYPSQPTRIVVLKPSPGQTHEIKIVASASPSSHAVLHAEDFYEEPGDESREVAKEITRRMHENVMGHRRYETLLSSVFSNGYIGDDSSFNRSDNEYPEENLSDTEVISPTSRHSWDYINRFGSPYSSSSFSRASCSPESSVCREAKKRLSERWATMASNGNCQEQRHIRRSSSTLGEMLALSDTKKLVRSEEEGSHKEQEARGSTSCMASNLDKEESTSDSPKNLLRSKSVPVSSTAYGARLNVEVPDSEVSKEHAPKELTKAKSMKSSFKGKVSSLFSSKNKKTNKEKSSGSQSTDESPSATPGTPGSPVLHLHKNNNDASQCLKGNNIDECLSPVPSGSASKTLLPDLIGMEQKHDLISMEGGLSVAKPMSIHGSENQDQPSPISVLEPPFDEDENTVSSSCGSIKPVHRGLEASPKSNLIDKSPPIESIARTLSWDDSCSETATLYRTKHSSISPGAKEKEEEDEEDWIFSVQSLLSAAGLNSKVQLESFIARWHSPESPLDPSLRYKYANLNDKEPQPLHEAKRRQWRSNRKLVFDCVNAALLEITGYGSDSCMRGRARCQVRMMEGAPLADHVWARMKEWFSSEAKCLDGDTNSLVVERVVQKEVVGKGWVDHMRSEIDILGRVIEGKLLEDLVEESVVDLMNLRMFLV